jgi:hypothetical protein
MIDLTPDVVRGLPLFERNIVTEILQVCVEDG